MKTSILILALFACVEALGEVTSVPTVEAFSDLAGEASWTELQAGTETPVNVTARIWNQAIQAALNKQGAVHLPKRAEPYYLDSPVILKSGQRLTADPDTEIRLKPNTNTCMVRNESVAGFNDKPVPDDLQLDTDISIEGGIWTTLANGQKDANGNKRGASSKEAPVPGTHGVILLQNVRRVTVRNVTVRQSKPFAVHLANVREFTVDGVRLDRHERDGVHVNGPASEGTIRNVSGNSHDDTVALNAWEWKNYAPSFGAIHHITIEHVTGSPEGIHSTDSIRLLPGLKRFSDGTRLPCPIHDILLRDIRDIREFKFYDQPNLELGRDKDFSIEPGELKNIKLERLVFNRLGVIQVATQVNGLTIHDVRLDFTPKSGFKLVEIGPMSATYRPKADDPSTWVEIFFPDRDVIVSGFSLSKVQFNGSDMPDAARTLVKVSNQQINPDYPKTTPRGGRGTARLVTSP